MGRATIISGGSDGYYTVALAKDTAETAARVETIAARVA